MTQTQSSYSDNGLGSAGITGNIISSEAGEVRIIGRYPERGVPKNEAPFSVDIEIDRYRNFWNSFLLIACPDAVIAALDPQSRKVLAISRILTSMWDGCRGQTRLVFGRSFRPDRNHPVIFELHPSNVTEANISEAKPLEETVASSKSAAALKHAGFLSMGIAIGIAGLTFINRKRSSQ